MHHGEKVSLECLHPEADSLVYRKVRILISQAGENSEGSAEGNQNPDLELAHPDSLFHLPPVITGFDIHLERHTKYERC